MAILFMLGWWYGKGWAWALNKIGTEIKNVGKMFAVGILLKTWFAPWKQITTTYSSETFIQKLVDNTISRLIGFIIRSFMLFIAFIWSVAVAFFGILMLIIWPFIPLSAVVLVVLYLNGVTI